ncbi:hypothetical protein [Pseudoalteromonas maricaloris]|uniref:hypothetical protein n=1 Tax=Pseudoalteromonas maricaloris TaxID=184924 RepID=UPI00029A0D68|nr:hypothetical protein [Pseudoalteromonas flavipulchra]
MNVSITNSTQRFTHNTAPSIYTIAQLTELVNGDILAGRKQDALSTLAQLQDATHRLEMQIHNMKDKSHG